MKMCSSLRVKYVGNLQLLFMRPSEALHNQCSVPGRERKGHNGDVKTALSHRLPPTTLCEEAFSSAIDELVLFNQPLAASSLPSITQQEGTVQNIYKKMSGALWAPTSRLRRALLTQNQN